MKSGGVLLSRMEPEVRAAFVEQIAVAKTHEPSISHEPTREDLITVLSAQKKVTSRTRILIQCLLTSHFHSVTHCAGG